MELNFELNAASLIIAGLIFAARIGDVTLGTLRAYFLTRGFKRYAVFFGFFESISWIVAIGQIFNNVNNPIAYLAYAGGYATGTYVGMMIAERLNVGDVIVRIIPKTDTNILVENLRMAGFGITTIAAQGKEGDVEIIFMVTKRRYLTRAIDIIHSTNPKAFFTVEEVRKVSEGMHPEEAHSPGLLPSFMNANRK
jgi:uncharacterized protein YebE (UPF0316 family)